MKDRDAVSDLACLATRCLSAAEFRREALAWVDRTVGIDGANLVAIKGSQVTVTQTRGLDRAWIDRFHHTIGGYHINLKSLVDASLSMGGASYGEWTRLEKWAALPRRQGFEEGMAFPVGFRIGSAVVITLQGAPRAVLFLGRAGRTRVFTAAEGAILARAAPVLALGEAVHDREVTGVPANPTRPRGGASRVALTPREQAVVEFAALGLGNREIGLALGVSPNTVRNHLAGIFEKLGVGSRAELVAVALNEGLVERRT